jgi:hypothetical protein
MKLLKAFVLVSLLIAGQFVCAQISEGQTTMNKINRPTISGEFNFSPEIVESVILEDLKYNGFPKASESKGFKFFAGIVFGKISSEKIDLYIKVDGVKKEKDKSVVTMVITKGPESYVSSGSDPETFKTASAYLLDLKPKFEARQLEINITVQEAVIKKAEKSYNSLIGTGESLQGKKADIEASIAKNKKEQEEQAALLEKERKLLEMLKSQRK